MPKGRTNDSFWLGKIVLKADQYSKQTNLDIAINAIYKRTGSKSIKIFGGMT